MLNLNDAQKLWLTQIDEKEMGELFNRLRFNRLQTLNVPNVDRDAGHKIQDEVAALHRIESLLKTERLSFVKPSSSSGQSKTK